ncbi:MAG: DNA translocase FtsK 4TM domain-containing protein, partial [Burkholderiales bacterium]|nr:DNA translocase FtsK 4TM domain-containing protein [Burkholderiales bacterium]
MLDMDKTQKFAKKNRDTLLPAKTALLLNDMVAVILFAVGFILAIMLITYNPNDNCWFKTANIAITHNVLGLVGAYFSDFILSVFGFSGWWFVFGLFYLGYRKIIRNKIDAGDWYTILQVMSFVFLIIGSSVFEGLYFYFQSIAYIHNGYGGLLGGFVYPIMSKSIGPLGTSVATIITMVFCFCFAFSVSIGNVAEKVGLVVDYVYIGFMKLLSKDGKIKEDVKINSDSEINKPLLMPKFFSKKDNIVPPAIYQAKVEPTIDANDDGFDVLFATLNADDKDRLINSPPPKTRFMNKINSTNTELIDDNNENLELSQAVYIKPENDVFVEDEPVEKKSSEYTYRETRQDFTVGK